MRALIHAVFFCYTALVFMDAFRTGFDKLIFIDVVTAHIATRTAHLPAVIQQAFLDVHALFFTVGTMDMLYSRIHVIGDRPEYLLCGSGRFYDDGTVRLDSDLMS